MEISKKSFCLLHNGRKCLAAGTMPESRHDLSVWSKTDAQRKKWKLKPVQKSILTEIRGDWAMFKNCFRLPAWNCAGGLCWLRTACASDISNNGREASWRRSPLSHWECISRMLTTSGSVSPIMEIPCIRTHNFLIDWLHAVDLGVCPDLLGNVLEMLLHKQEGTNKTLKCQALFLKMKEYYKREKVQDKLDNLTLLMIRKAGSKSPKLRAKAAEARNLIGFAKEQAMATFNDNDIIEKTAK